MQIECVQNTMIFILHKTLVCSKVAGVHTTVWFIQQSGSYNSLLYGNIWILGRTRRVCIRHQSLLPTHPFSAESSRRSDPAGRQAVLGLVPLLEGEAVVRERGREGGRR